MIPAGVWEFEMWTASRRLLDNYHRRRRRHSFDSSDEMGISRDEVGISRDEMGISRDEGDRSPAVRSGLSAGTNGPGHPYHQAAGGEGSLYSNPNPNPNPNSHPHPNPHPHPDLDPDPSPNRNPNPNPTQARALRRGPTLTAAEAVRGARVVNAASARTAWTSRRTAALALTLTLVLALQP